MMPLIFNLFSDGSWICNNPLNFVQAPCYKITTCDPQDDLIESFVSVMAGVSKICSKQNYDTQDFRIFYSSLLVLMQFENSLFQTLTKQNFSDLQSNMIENIKMLDTIPESNMMAESYRSITQTGIAFLKEKFDITKRYKCGQNVLDYFAIKDFQFYSN